MVGMGTFKKKNSTGKEWSWFLKSGLAVASCALIRRKPLIQPEAMIINHSKVWYDSDYKLD